MALLVIGLGLLPRGGAPVFRGFFPQTWAFFPELRFFPGFTNTPRGEELGIGGRVKGRKGGATNAVTRPTPDSKLIIKERNPLSCNELKLNRQ